MHFLRLAGGLAWLALLAAACSAAGSSPVPASPSPLVVRSTPFIPEIVSSQVIVGHNRLLIGLLDAAGKKPIGSPDTSMSVTFALADHSGTPIGPEHPVFVWAIPDERGVFVSEVDFPDVGEFAASVQASGGGVPAATVQIQFQVTVKGSAIPIGGKAPDMRTPTATDVGGDLKKISTDPSPDPSFYAASVDELLKDHKPFVLVFATPAFCTSRQCGPTLDAVKAFSKDEPGITYVHVEPYKLELTSDGRLQPILDASGQLQPTDVVKAWGILSEPWVFVVDDQGIVRGSFEAVVSAGELTAVIDSVK